MLPIDRTLAKFRVAVWTLCLSLGLAASAASQCLHDEHDRLVPAGLMGGESMDEVAVFGDHAALGAPGTGGVYTYEHDGRLWQQGSKLVPGDQPLSSSFGACVDIDGDTLVVGYPLDSSVPPQFIGPEVGSVYVFEWDGTQWVETQKVIASLPLTGMLFGRSIAICDDVLVIGTAWEDFYVFHHDGTQWQEQVIISSPEPNWNANFSGALATDGDRILCGTSSHDLSVRNEGTAYMYRRVGSFWVFEKKLFATDFHQDQLFGNSVGLDGDVAVIGARWDDGAGNKAGAAYVFHYDPVRRNWAQAQKLSQGDAGDEFGSAVALRADRISVGAPGAQWAGVDGGTAYAYHREGSTWIAGLQLMPSEDARSGDRFGSGVDVSLLDTFVGAEGADLAGPDAGAAYTYRATALSFDVRPNELSTGDQAVFEVCKGQPDGIVLPALRQWDGQVMFHSLGIRSLDGAGRWSQTVTIPPGIHGVTAIFEVYGFSSTSTKVVAAWEEIVWFNR